jgi:inosine-uridine nucleoside N-ribohydrolase
MTKRNILVDSDFHALADDHEALAMVAAQHVRSELNLLGVTTVTGNTWASTGADHAATAIAELNLANVSVHEGASQPLLHRQADFAHRSRLYGAAFGGAWGNADLLEKQPSPQPASKTGGGHAVTYLIDTIRACQDSVTILAIGPLTNIALALRLAPDISDNIDRIVCMGGAFFVPGNVTPSAEFNWWFDPEAAAIVLEEDLDLLIVPLDATDKVVLDFDRYQDWSKRFAEHEMFLKFHRPKFESVFAKDGSFTLPVWDAAAAACLLDDSVIDQSDQLWVSVDCSVGPSYGRVVAYPDATEFNLVAPARRRANIVLQLNSERFWNLYEELVFSAISGEN